MEWSLQATFNPRGDRTCIIIGIVHFDKSKGLKGLPCLYFSVCLLTSYSQFWTREPDFFMAMGKKDSPLAMGKHDFSRF